MSRQRKTTNKFIRKEVINMTKEQLMEQEQAFIQDQQNLWEQWEKDHNPDETFIDRWDDIED